MTDGRPPDNEGRGGLKTRVSRARTTVEASRRTTLAASGGPDDEYEEAIPACEDFDAALEDMSRIYAAWVSNSRAGFRARRQACAEEARRIEADRAKMVAEMEELRRAESECIKADRLRAEQEVAAMAKQIAAERENARQRIQEDRKKLEVERLALQQSLRIEQERLRRELDALDRERHKICDANVATQTVVEVNVGGVVFETARSVLQQMPDSYLAALVSGRHEVERDRHGRIFIDRDASLFAQILAFLRDPGVPICPPDDSASAALAREAAFYEIRFFDQPLVFCIGGNDGVEYLRSGEVLDLVQQCWRQCATLETARAYFAAGSILNKIYVAGGQNLDYKALCDVEAYDVLRDCWLPAPALLSPRKSLAGAVSNGRFFAAGGFNGFEILSSVEALDPRVRGWVQVAPLTTPRSAAMMVVQNEDLVVLGGSCGDRLRSGELYDARMDKWTPLEREMLEVRSGGCAVGVFETVFAAGGIDGAQRVHDSVEAADVLGAQPWAYRRSLPTPRVDASAAEVTASVVVTGGQAYGEVTDSVDFYRPELDAWQTGPNLLTARFAHQTVTSNV